MSSGPDPSNPAEGLAEERTSLAWERTGISLMVAGVLLARYAGSDDVPVLVAAGMAQLVLGAVVLVWAGLRYADLHAWEDDDGSPAHPAMARAVGLGTVASSAVGLALVVVLTIRS